MRRFTETERRAIQEVESTTQMRLRWIVRGAVTAHWGPSNPLGVRGKIAIYCGAEPTAYIEVANLPVDVAATILALIGDIANDIAAWRDV